jgi:RNA polymerase sigma factor (TIGR02999 family)
MRLSVQGEVTNLLVAWHDGDADALNRIVPLVYVELGRLAHRYMRAQPGEHILQTTALVNELYLKIADASHISWTGRVHFLAVCAQVMRRLLVDSARAKHSLKRGQNLCHIQIDDDLQASALTARDIVQLDDALTALAMIDPRKSKAIELRFFGGLDVEETAEALGISRETVLRDWRLAKAWLKSEIERESGHG